MTTLAKDAPRSWEIGLEEYNDLPVVASDIIYEGAAVGENGSGYSRPLVAGDRFQGFCTEKADNSAGSAGAIDVRMKSKGRIKVAVTGVTGVADEGKKVYASDDDTFTLTATSNSEIGSIFRWVSSTTCIVAFERKTV